ncbi:MAG: hypothetical protein ABH886_08450 [Candidatus Desantisbacteria bacterium]
MKKILILFLILFLPAFLHAEERSKPFNISGTKMFSSVYTDIKGSSTNKSEGFKLNQSTRLLLEGKTKDGLNAYMNYDDTRQINPLEMLVNYQKGILAASFGHMDIVLNETEFSGYNSRMFGAKAGVKTDKFNTQVFGATNRGIAKIAIYQGDIGKDFRWFCGDDYIIRKYYLLLPEQVNNVLMDDGIFENGDGFTTLTLSTDYTILQQTLGTTTIPVLVLTTPAETDAIIQVVYKDSGTLTIKGPDTADEEIHSYYKLNYPDVLPGKEVIGSLTRGIDYQINYSDGSVYFATKTVFNIDYDYAAKTYRLEPPVLPGSERVMVNGNQRQRGIDYTVNYETGEVRFFDSHASGIYADSEVKIEYETVAEGNRYNLSGLRGGYSLEKWMSVGCTYLSKSDAAPKAKTTQVMAQMNHQIIGFDANIYPMEGLKITGEVAASRKEPGNHGKIFVDDMEGDDILTRWKALSSGVKLAAEKTPEFISHPESTDNHQALRISCGQGTNTIEQIFNTPLDLSLYSNMGIWIQTPASVTITLCLYSVSTHYFLYDISPDRVGEYLYIKKNLTTDAVLYGLPDMKNINRIQIILNNNGTQAATMYLDDLIATGGLARDGLAKKVEAVLENERFKFKAGIKDIDYGFVPIGLNNFESISDTRAYQAEAQFPLVQQSTLLLKYENKLKSKSIPEKQLKSDMFSTGIKFNPSDAFKFNIDYKQEDENDCKAVQQISNVNKKTTASIDINKENILHLSSFGFFNRLMNINSRDNIHNLHTSSNHTYLRFNLEPVSGMEIIPEYKLKSTKDLNKDTHISEEENILSAINITSSDKLSTILRYAHDNLSNFVLNSKQDNQSLSIEFGLTQDRWPSLNTFLENTRKKQLENQLTTSRTNASDGDLKLAFSSPEKWKWLVQYRFTRSSSDGVKNKTDNYMGEVTRWFRVWKQAGTSSLTPRISQDITDSIVVDTYFVSWETIFKRGISTKLSHELSKRDISSKNVPSIKIGYTTEKWNASSEIKQTKNLNKITSLKTTDNLSSLSAGYKLKDRLTINESFTCSDSESTHKTTYSSSTEINWEINKMLNAILKSVWSSVHDQVNSGLDYETNKVGMDVSIVF